MKKISILFSMILLFSVVSFNANAGDRGSESLPAKVNVRIINNSSINYTPQYAGILVTIGPLAYMRTSPIFNDVAVFYIAPGSGSITPFMPGHLPHDVILTFTGYTGSWYFGIPIDTEILIEDNNN